MAKVYTVRCKKLNPDGTGLVTFNNSSFAVRGVLPGEKCEIELVYGKNGTTAALVRVLEPSGDRAIVDCPAYEKCGGCNMLHMSYDAEIRFKQELIKQLYDGIEAPLYPIIRADNPLNYRNKVYSTFSFEKYGRGNTRLIAGMYEENSHRVVNVQNCLIQKKVANSIIKTMLDVMRITKTRSYDADTKTGTIRHVYIRVSEKTGKVMLVIVTGSRELPAKKQFIDTLVKQHPCIETIVHNVNSAKTSMILGDKSTVIYGNGYITDELLGKKFKISPESFYQVNPVQTEKLYKAAIEMAELKKTDTVIDAYCGIGTISLIVSDSVKAVKGIELNKRAVRDAQENAKLNGAENVEFIAGDAGKYMTENKDFHPDVIFMDPPRNGSTEEFLLSAAGSGAERIVYISCNPETQGRDIAFLLDHGYEIEGIRAVDMFPRTAKIESIVKLYRA